MLYLFLTSETIINPHEVITKGKGKNMKKSLIALATIGALSGVAHADSNVTVYGVVDAAVRTANNQNANGDSLNSVGNGLLQGNRLGFKGQEDLGGGLKAVFQLESGFNIDDGTAAQNGATFSRNATVGLSDSTLGTLTVGRQNNLGYDTLIATDVYGVANNVAVAGYQSVLSGFRWNNSLKYTNEYQGFNFGAQVASGNTVGSDSTNSGYSLAAGYKASNWAVQGVYQKAHDTKDGELGSLAGQDQDFWALGGKYAFNDQTSVYGQYVHSKFNTSEQVNQIYTVGVAQKLSGNWSVKAAATYDKQENVNEGNRQTYSAIVDYAFSKRTDVYAAVDYNKLGSGYSNASYSLNSATNGNSNSTGLTFGLSHQF